MKTYTITYSSKATSKYHVESVKAANLNDALDALIARIGSERIGNIIEAKCGGVVVL